MSSRPVPAVPPFGSLLSVAPAGKVVTFSVPGWKAGFAFSVSSSSTMLKPLMSEPPAFSTRSV